MKKLVLAALAATTMMGTAVSAGGFELKNDSHNHIEILIRYDNQSTVYTETAEFGSGFGDNGRYQAFNFGNNTAYVSVKPKAGLAFGWTHYKIEPNTNLRVDYAGAVHNIYKSEYATAGENTKDLFQYRSGEYNSLEIKRKCAAAGETNCVVYEG